MIRVTDPGRCQPYCTDASNLPGGSADGIVLPASESEVVEFLREAYEHRVPVTVAGHGSGLVGGRIPFGGWVLSTERLCRLRMIRVDATHRVAVVEPGVPLGRLQDAAQSAGLIYPPDPTERDAFVGGSVSTNASGACSFKYGTTRRYVRALRAVLPDGQTLALTRGVYRAKRRRLVLETEQGRRIHVLLPSYRMPGTKHAAGYFVTPGLDAVDLFVGSEGTLGVVTQVTVELRPAPEHLCSFVAFFSTEEAAWGFAIAARRLSRQKPAMLEARAIEYLDRYSLELLRPDHPQIPAQAQSAIYIEQESTGQRVSAHLERWRRFVADYRGMDDRMWVASTREEQAKLKALRRALPLAIKEQLRRNGRPKVGTDMAVPDRQLLPFMRAYRRVLDRLGQPYCLFGHIGDNHLHANIMPRSETELFDARKACVALVKRAVALGGTLSAEHGVGKLKRTFLGLLYSRRELYEMRQVKAALDPHWILGQGNIFER